MSQIQHIVATLKQQLKQRGLTYAEVARALDMSESSVKRSLANGDFPLSRLESLCRLAGLDVAELVRLACETLPVIHELTEAQERELAADARCLLMAVCLLNHWSFARIIATYTYTEAEGIAYLMKLERLGLISVLPENRVRLLVSREFSWRPAGPIQQFFQLHVEPAFMDSPFSRPGEMRLFVHGMLTPAAHAKLAQRLRRVVQEFSDLHTESTEAAEPERFGTSLLLAFRAWEPPIFARLRREPDARRYPGVAPE